MGLGFGSGFERFFQVHERFDGLCRFAPGLNDFLFQIGNGLALSRNLLLKRFDVGVAIGKLILKIELHVFGFFQRLGGELKFFDLLFESRFLLIDTFLEADNFFLMLPAQLLLP